MQYILVSECDFNSWNAHCNNKYCLIWIVSQSSRACPSEIYIMNGVLLSSGGGAYFWERAYFPEYTVISILVFHTNRVCRCGLALLPEAIMPGHCAMSCFSFNCFTIRTHQHTCHHTKWTISYRHIIEVTFNYSVSVYQSIIISFVTQWDPDPTL